MNDGTIVAAESLRTAGLAHAGVAAGEEHRVGDIARIVRIQARDHDDDEATADVLHGIGDNVTLVFWFSKWVWAPAGEFPKLDLQVGEQTVEQRRADIRWQDRVWYDRYEVAEGDLAEDGVYLNADPLSGGRLRHGSGSGSPVFIEFAAWRPPVAMRVDGVRPELLAEHAATTGDGAAIVLPAGEALDAAAPPAAHDFEVLVDDAVRAVTAVAVRGVEAGAPEEAVSEVVLTLAQPVAWDDVVTVSYADPDDGAGDDENAVQDLAGNDAPSLAATAVTVTVPPEPVIVAVALFTDPGADATYGIGDVVGAAVTFSDPVTVTGTPWLTIEVGGVDQAADYATGSGGEVLSFAYVVADGDADADGVTIAAGSVEPAGGSIVTRDTPAALAHPAGSHDPAGHRVDGVRPALVSDGAATSADGATVALTYDQELAPVTPAASAFELQVDPAGDTEPAAAVAVNAVAVAGTTATLTLRGAVVPAGATVTVSYTSPATDPLQDLTGNPAAALAGQPVINGSTSAADAVVVSVAALRGAVDEGASAKFTLHRSGSTEAALEVQVLVVRKGGFFPDDYQPPATVTFASGAAGATLAVPTVDDDVGQNDGEVIVRLQVGDDYAVAASAAQATVTVRDHGDVRMEVFLEHSAVTVAEGDGSATVPQVVVTRVVAQMSPRVEPLPVAVRVVTEDDTARAGADYVALSTVVEIAADAFSEENKDDPKIGQIASVSVAVTIIDDNDAQPSRYEGDERFLVRLERTADTPATVRLADDRVTATVTITDASPEPVLELAVAPDYLREGESAQVTVASANGAAFAAAQEIGLQFAGSAEAGFDFTLAAGATVLTAPHTLTLPAGATTTAATLAALADAHDDESDETVTVAASHRGAALGSVRTLTIGSAPTPVITGAAIWSSPDVTHHSSGKLYGAGETLLVALTFSEPVTVSGTPRLALRVGANTRQADWDERSSSATELAFAYTVADDDKDANGFSLNADSLTVDGGAIVSAAAAAIAADLGHDGFASDPNHRVGDIVRIERIEARDHDDAPIVTDHTFGIGDRVGLTFHFTGTVWAGGDVFPRLHLQVGDETVVRRASERDGSELYFDRYVVAEGDLADDGIYLDPDPLSEGWRLRHGPDGGVSVFTDFGRWVPPVVLRVDGVRPLLAAAAVTGELLLLTYDEALDADALPPAEEFAVQVAGAPRAVSGVAVSGRQVTLTLAASVVAGQEVTLSDSAAVRDAAGNGASPTLDFAVRNDTPVVPLVSVAAAAAEVTEGDAAQFTFERTGATAAALTAAVRVDAGDAEGFLAAGALLPQQVEFDAGATTAAITMTTVDDTAEEPDGTLRVTVLDGADYTPLPGAGHAEVTLADDDTVSYEMAVSSSPDEDCAVPEDEEADACVTEGQNFTITVTLRADSRRDPGRRPHGGDRARGQRVDTAGREPGFLEGARGRRHGRRQGRDRVGGGLHRRRQRQPAGDAVGGLRVQRRLRGAAGGAGRRAAGGDRLLLAARHHRPAGHRRQRVGGQGDRGRRGDDESVPRQHRAANSRPSTTSSTTSPGTTPTTLTRTAW